MAKIKIFSKLPIRVEVEADKVYKYTKLDYEEPETDVYKDLEDKKDEFSKVFTEWDKATKKLKMMEIRADSANKLGHDEEVLSITKEYDKLFEVATGLEESLKVITNGEDVKEYTDKINEQMLRLEVTGDDAEELFSWSSKMKGKWSAMRNHIDEAVSEAKGKLKKR